jgi:hypothetical protein
MIPLPLGTATLGVSISDSQDLLELGLSSLHLRHAMVELVRHVLAAGGSVAYGGDLRPGGYTTALFDLLRSYPRRDRPGPERVVNYLAWPLWVHTTISDRAALTNVATLVNVQAPQDAPDTLPVGELSPAQRLWFARSLTKMREEMTARITARLVIGGIVAGQQGLAPGVIEEAALAIESGVPLFVVGGFGGAGRVIVALLNGSSPQELALDYQLAHGNDYQALREAAAAHNIEPTVERYAQLLRSRGWEGLKNGLSADENHRLGSTDDADEIVALVLRGLRRAHV